MPTAPCPLRRARRMNVIAIAGDGPQGVVHRCGGFVRVPAVILDSTVVRLIGFPGGQPV